MFKNVSLFQTLRPYAPAFFLLCAVLVLMLLPDMAHASATSDLPFTDGLEKLKGAISGPVAFGISLVGIIAAGAMLIFGGEMSGFLRTLVFLVLVIAIIVNASNIIVALGGNAAMIAAQVEQSIGAIRGQS
jgi:type IV secretion system protein VirB2